MTLDNTTKVVSIVSVVVGLMLSVAGYFANAQLQSLQASITKLSVADKDMDVAKKSYDISARLTAEFSLHLARSFAIQYSQFNSKKDQGGERILFPTTDLANEFTKVLAGWQSRQGLMTGKACELEGLKARQVVTLVVKNIGNADASEIRIRAMWKASPVDDPAKRWQEKSPQGGDVLGYYDLLSATTGWKSDEFPIGDLRGLSSPENVRIPEKVVLASVSGASDLYGTVLVPVEISWYDDITKKRQTLPILQSLAPALRADLMGAEIGRVSSACK